VISKNVITVVLMNGWRPTSGRGNFESPAKKKTYLRAPADSIPILWHLSNFPAKQASKQSLRLSLGKLGSKEMLKRFVKSARRDCICVTPKRAMQ
jgi:hypothetical protein